MNNITVSNYQEYKAELDRQLRESAEGFVRIGYLLKLARDTDILNGSGYANVNDFAKAEYNLDKSMVSRFININDRFAEGGNSQCLKEQYRGFGYSKLAIMLQLPDEINEELNPNFSKSEIQAIKEEVDAEAQISDIETLIEGEKNPEITNNLHKALYQLLEDMPDLYIKLYHYLFNLSGKDCYDAIWEALVPDGEKVYSIRIQGIGRMMLFLNENEEHVTLTNIRSREKEQFEKKKVSYFIDMIITSNQENAEKEWEATYGREFPKKEEVAPVQPQPAPKKETKVVKAKESKKAAVEKTEEQKYSERQAKIDRQTKKKLEEIEDKKKMEVLPSEMPKTVHSIRIGKTFFDDEAAGIKPFTLRKNDRDYKVGDILEKMEFDDGKYTGRTLRQEVMYKLEDYTGLVEGYCILGVKNLEVIEE